MKKFLTFLALAFLATTAFADDEKEECERAMCEQVNAALAPAPAPVADDELVVDPRNHVSPSQFVEDKVRRLIGPGNYIPSSLWKWDCGNRRKS